MSLATVLFACAAFASSASALDSHELCTNFITRPDIKAPRIRVAKQSEDSIPEGLWFVAPVAEVHPTNDVSPCQTGGHIYDGNGALVWSGADKFGGRDISGLRPLHVDGNQYLSAHVPLVDGDEEAFAVLLDNAFQVVSALNASWIDPHETRFSTDGKTAIFSTTKSDFRVAEEIGPDAQYVVDTGFVEVDIATGKKLFEWNPLDHNISMAESFAVLDLENDPARNADWFGINSVDRSGSDFLVSARNTQTIYKIARKDGRVLWRLGGMHSDFAIPEDVRFKWQHDARVLFENETQTVISLFDNHERQAERETNVKEFLPSAKILLLDSASKPMQVRLVRNLKRRDELRTPNGGNAQILGDNAKTSSVFVNWGAGFSEFDRRGEMVVDAMFVDDRLKSYRAFKGTFQSKPSEPIAFKLLPMAFTRLTIASAFHVSWNGATDVASWALYGGSTAVGPFHLLATIARNGFETSWVASELVPYAYAQALDVHGRPLGQSAVASLEPAQNAAGSYKIIVPLLEDAKAVYSENTTVVQLALERLSAAYGAALSAKKQRNGIPLPTSKDLLFSLTGAFAAYGMYSMVRRGVPFVAGGRRRRSRVLSIDKTCFKEHV